MGLINRFQSVFLNQGKKESQARIVATINQLGRAVETPINFENLSKHGYSKNVVVYTAISKITSSSKGVGWVLYARKGNKLNEIEQHPFLDLWNNPNPLQDLSSFIESLIGFYMITGNSYLELIKPLGVSKGELWPVRPDHVRIVAGSKGYPSKYVIKAGGKEYYYDVDPVNFKCSIKHLKMFNPVDLWYGLSPLSSAMLAIDQNNSGNKWNLSLLQNSATPSGVLTVETTDANPRGELSDKKYDQLQKDIDDRFTGQRNAGRPMLLEGGLKWTSIALSPKDMDFVNNKSTTATDICLALGVPPELMGYGAKTFANYKEARLAFTEETILPVLSAVRDFINKYILPDYGENLYLDFDKDTIEALVEKREARYTTLANANFLKINEKREAAGYDKEDGLDVFLIANEILTTEDIATYNTPEETGSDDETDNTTQDQSTQESPPNEDEDEGQDETSGAKSINLINSREKRTAWKVQNRKRNTYTKFFYRDLKEDYKELTLKLAEAAQRTVGSSPRLIEFALEKELTEFESVLKKTIGKNVRSIIKDFGGEIFQEGKSLPGFRETKANLKFDQYVLAYIEKRTGSNIKSIINTNSKQIKRIVAEWTAQSIQDGMTVDELSKFLQMEFEELSESNAQRIARTEVSLASQNGSLEAVKALGIPNMTKEWVSASDDRVRDGDKGGPDHAAMNGTVVGLDEKFNVPPDCDMEGPGDGSAPAEQVINCRCVLVYKSNN